VGDCHEGCEAAVATVAMRPEGPPGETTSVEPSVPPIKSTPSDCGSGEVVTPKRAAAEGSIAGEGRLRGQGPRAPAGPL